MLLQRITAALILACGLALGSDTPPLNVHSWEGEARMEGALLLTPLKLTFVSSVCKQLLQNIHLTHTTISALLNSKVFTTTDDNVNFVRRLSFIVYKIEVSYTEIFQYIQKNLMCEEIHDCLLYTSPSPRDKRQSRMPSSA